MTRPRWPGGDAWIGPASLSEARALAALLAAAECAGLRPSAQRIEDCVVTAQAAAHEVWRVVERFRSEQSLRRIARGWSK